MAGSKPSKTIIIIAVIALAILAGFIYGMVYLFSTETKLLEYGPQPRKENAGSNLIWYDPGNPADTKHWIDSLNELIKPYENVREKDYDYRECYDDHIANSYRGEVCIFDPDYLGSHCTKADSWGYTRRSPCVILKASKNIGWVPEVYNKTDIDNHLLPEDMPLDLKNRIMDDTANNGGTPPPMVWVSCEGKYPDDREHLGPLEYTPWQGFPAYYFPYMETPGYLPPLVAVRIIENYRSVAISIECKLWAKNIKHSEEDTSGIINFELLRD